MLSRLRTLDRRRALALGLILMSISVFAAGVIGILVAVSGGGADLPHEGSIEDIVATPAGQPTAAGVPSDVPKGPAPTRFMIPALYIDAPIITKSLGADGLPAVPDRPDQVAWYDFSATPGMKGNAVFSGHVDWQTTDRVPIPGVFYRLREMKIGDVIEVTLEDGSTIKYRVTGNVATPYDDPNVVKVMNPLDRDVITVITCGGAWIRNGSEANGGNYSHRVIVRAERITGAGGESASAAGG
jgi:LPXTG-site transpeptidase (sortase) family protein